MKRYKKELEKIQKNNNHPFYREHRKGRFKVISIIQRKGTPFFLPKSFMERQSRKSLIRYNNTEIVNVILDWEGLVEKHFGMINNPIHFLVDKKGIIKYKKQGFIIINKDLEQTIKKLLEE